MKSGAMFGNLGYYEDEQYGLSHSTICFDSLYEKREYELIAVFYSQVYYQSDDVFKYYEKNIGFISCIHTYFFNYCMRNEYFRKAIRW